MNLNSEIIVKMERRSCIVDGQMCLFHCWEQYGAVLEPSLLIGGHPGGQVARVYGIVEFPDGTVKRVDINDIKFNDKEQRDLYLYNDYYQNRIKEEGETE